MVSFKEEEEGGGGGGGVNLATLYQEPYPGHSVLHVDRYRLHYFEGIWVFLDAVVLLLLHLTIDV